MKTESLKWITPMTWLLRLVVGGVFIFSGFSKAIDPWGTLYKVDDYLAAMSLTLWPNLILVGVFGLCALEFAVGIFIATGCFRRSGIIVGTVIMVFMLPLTFWIALKDPVADCGCFGDAFVISNWATFWKNVALSSGICWLIKFNKTTFCLITPALQWIALILSGAFILTVELYGYHSQPLIDFRPYKAGENLVDYEMIAGDGPKFVFIYEKDGVRKEFGEEDELPDESDGWAFVDRKEIPSKHHEDKKVAGEASKNLRIWSKDGEEDETENAVVRDGDELIVMMPDLKEVSPAMTWKLNSLNEWSLKNDITMIAVVSGSEEEIANWEDLSMASYPIYTADDTQLKEVVRGNPGVVYLENGKVVWKSTLGAIDIDDFLQPDTNFAVRDFSLDNESVLRNYGSLYIILMGVLIVLSFTPRLKHIYSPEAK